MGQLDRGGIITLQELMITTLATANAVARLLIEKGLITQQEFDLKRLSEQAGCEALLHIEEVSVERNE